MDNRCIKPFNGKYWWIYWVGWWNNSTDLPDPISDAALYELAKTHQVHHHSKSCKKYKNDKCRFHLRKFFNDRLSLSAHWMLVLLFQKGKIFQRKEMNFKGVPDYINDEIKPGKIILNESLSKKYWVWLMFQKIDTTNLFKYQKIVIFKFILAMAKILLH